MHTLCFSGFALKRPHVLEVLQYNAVVVYTLSFSSFDAAFLLHRISLVPMTIDRVVLHDSTYTTLLLTHLEAKQECDALLLGAWQFSVM